MLPQPRDDTGVDARDDPVPPLPVPVSVPVPVPVPAPAAPASAPASAPAPTQTPVPRPRRRRVWEESSDRDDDDDVTSAYASVSAYAAPPREVQAEGAARRLLLLEGEGAPRGERGGRERGEALGGADVGGDEHEHEQGLADSESGAGPSVFPVGEDVLRDLGELRDTASSLAAPSVFTVEDTRSLEGAAESRDAVSSIGMPPLLPSFTLGPSLDNENDSDEERDSDNDSAMGREPPSSSVSADSSVFEFIQAYGRTFHSYKEGKYPLPNDTPEQERLDLQHEIITRLFGTLAFAPVETPPRVLDLGTGTGIWAIEYALEHPESDVLGTDLSPIQPLYVPPNCRFEVDDADDEWLFSHPFDFIHARFTCFSFGSFPRIFRCAIENLVPGGWIEFQDYILQIQDVDGSLKGTSLERWNELVLQGMIKMGKSGTAPTGFAAQMRDAGFEDVQERRFTLPGNPWTKGYGDKGLGALMLANALKGLHGTSIKMFTKMHGMSVEEVEVLLVDVRKDLKNRNIPTYYIMMSVFGRKPL